MWLFNWLRAQWFTTLVTLVIGAVSGMLGVRIGTLDEAPTHVKLVLALGFASGGVLVIVLGRWGLDYIQARRGGEGAKATPVVEIQYRDGFPFFQEGRTPNPNDVEYYRLYRIAVQNITSATLDDLEVKLTAIRPLDEIPTRPFIPIPVHLHIMNDNPTPGQPQRNRFSLHSGSTEWVDVVSRIDVPGTGDIEICHIVPYVNRRLPVSRFQLEITAYGRNVEPPVSKTFEVGVRAGFDQDQTERLYLLPVDLAERRRLLVCVLTRLRDEATHDLLNGTVENEDDLTKLKQRIRSWELDVVREMAGVIPDTDAAWFRTLTTYTPKGLSGWSAEHGKERNMLAERLDRLLMIARRLEERVTPKDRGH
jgi:hypothetical protein